VGRLVDWKRLDFVLQAVASIPEAQLEVIGDGPMRSTWAAKAESLGIASRVRWLGWLPQPECAQHLSGATALLLPSIYECGGAVVLEAMACATPVVATAWGGPADYLDQSCGILIDVSDLTPVDASAILAQKFADAMRKLTSNSALRHQLGSAGRERVERFFDWNKKIGHILTIYRKAINEHRS
jgi:glycosyltransferase involved in cell wall biosynthesis